MPLKVRNHSLDAYAGFRMEILGFSSLLHHNTFTTKNSKRSESQPGQSKLTTTSGNLQIKLYVQRILNTYVDS
jgi:hypothetical protein